MGRSIEGYLFFTQLRGLSFVKAIWLYGSRARGDNKERSDIDIAIDCSGATDFDWLAVVSIVEEADTLLHIDCVRLDELKDSNPLKKSILSEGICIYKR